MTLCSVKTAKETGDLKSFRMILFARVHTTPLVTSQKAPDIC